MKVQTLKERALFFLGLAIPLDYRVSKESTGLISFSTAELVVLLLFSFWVFGSSSDIKQSMDPDKKNRILFALYLFWSLVVSLVALDVEMLQIWRDALEAFLVLMMVSAWVVSEKSAKMLLNGYLFSMVLNSFLGILQILFDGPRPIALEEHSADMKENFSGDLVTTNMSTGVFGHPNGFALFLSIAIAICIARLLWKRRGFSDIPLLMMLGLFFLNLYYTYGKGAVSWTIIGISLLLTYRYILKKFQFLSGVAILLVAISAIVFYALPHLMEEGGGGTLASRIILWGVAMDVISNSPAGFFFGNNHHAILDASTLYSSFEYTNAHNTFLNELVYFGLFGFLLFTIFMFRSLYLVSRATQNSTDKALVYGVWAAQVVLMGNAFFEPIHQTVGNLGLIMMLGGLASSRIFVSWGGSGKEVVQ